MKIVKYIVMFVLPILIFVNLWRVLQFGNTSAVGIRYAVDYTSTYRGWEFTVKFFNYMYDVCHVDNAGEGILLVLSPLWAPVAVIIALISDIIYHVTFFFGWIGTSLFIENHNTSSSFEPWIIVQQISFVPLIRSIGV